MKQPLGSHPGTPPPRLTALLLVTVLAAACRGGAPADYKPLPVIAPWPQVLHDAVEVRAYLKAFPIDRYRRYEVQDLGSFYVDDPRDLIKKVIVEGRPWEKHVVKLIREHLKPGMIALDLGAYIGTHTVLMSMLVGPWGRVYAFEPQMKIYRELHYNLELNGANNVLALRYALGDGPARIVEMNPTVAGNEGATEVGSGGDAVELRSLDSFGFDRVGLIKIDVEGFENQVLDGAGQTIRKSRPTIIIEIVGGCADHATAPPPVQQQIAVTVGKLKALGYSVSRVGKHDYLALPAS